MHKSPYPPLRPLTPAEQALVEKNVGLAHQQASRAARMVARYYKYRLTTAVYQQFGEEFIGHAMIGLVIAAQRFDPSLGYKFSTFAYHTIRGQVSAAHAEIMERYGPRRRNHAGRPYRVKMLSEVAGSIKAPHPGEEMEVYDPRPVEEEPGVSAKTLRELLFEYLDRRLARIVDEKILQDRTLKQIGDCIALSKERVRQLLKSALVQLRMHPLFLAAIDKYLDRKRQDVQAEDIGGCPVRIA